MKHKKYCYKSEAIYSQALSNEEIKNHISTIIKEEPEEIPAEQDLFDVWRYEYIKKGLREY